MGGRAILKTENVNFDKINENTVFQDSLFGNDGQEVDGISIGNNHEIGVVLK